MNIDWKERIKNPVFWIGLVGVIMSPILAYNGMSYEDLTTWAGLGELMYSFITNPFLVGSVVLAVAGLFGVAVDPSTPGLSDPSKKNHTKQTKDK